MASILKVDTIQDQSGNNIINENADTITIGASGDTVNVVGTLQNNGSALASGITEADMFRLTADLTSSADPISSNLERVDDATFSKIGTGMSLSSGVYTFPTTGLYYITYRVLLSFSASDVVYIDLNASSDSGSTYDRVSRIGIIQTANSLFQTNSGFVNVTNASTFRVKFSASSVSNVTLIGDTTENLTSFTFIRLGDSQ